MTDVAETEPKSKKKIWLPAIEPIVLDLQNACHYLSLKASTFQELVRTGDLPKPRLLSRRGVGWRKDELLDWVNSRPVANLLPPKNTGARKAHES